MPTDPLDEITVGGAPGQWGSDLIVSRDGFLYSAGRKGFDVRVDPAAIELAMFMASQLPPAMSDELAGWLHGLSGPDQDRLRLLNCVGDTECFGYPREALTRTSVAVGRAADGGGFVVGAIHAAPLAVDSMRKYLVRHRHLPAADRMGFVHWAAPGMVGCHVGLNSAGLFVAAHEVPTPLRSCRKDAITTPALARQLLEYAGDIEGVEALLDGRKPYSGVALLVASRTNQRMAVYEVDAESYVRRDPVGGRLACTHLFEQKVSLTGNRALDLDSRLSRSPESVERQLGQAVDRSSSVFAVIYDGDELREAVVAPDGGPLEFANVVPPWERSQAGRDR